MISYQLMILYLVFTISILMMMIISDLVDIDYKGRNIKNIMILLYISVMIYLSLLNLLR